MFNKKLNEKIDKLIDDQRETARDTDKRLDAIEKVLLVQENNLQTHMQRSEHLETIVESMQEKEIKPIRKHINMVEGAFKLLGVVALLVSIAGGIAKLLGIV